MKRSVLALTTLAVLGASQAQANLAYDILTARVTFNDGTQEDLTFNFSGNMNEKIDFTAGLSPLLIGDGATPKTAATIDIIYTVTSDVAITGLDLVFSGRAFDMATIGYSEVVETMDGSVILGVLNGNRDGAGLGGDNGSFVVNQSLDFGTAVTEYKVKKSFVLANLDSNPVESFASIGFIEQNAQPVPEPASMAALGLGALAMLRRRRKAA